jgi:hypothetical protein
MTVTSIMRSAHGARSLAFLGSVLAMSSCVEPSDREKAFAGTGRAVSAPSSITFPLVGAAMQPRCGTLDCHGQAARNLRLYGARGLRKSAADNSAEGATSMEEYLASYASIVGLEPETMSAVVEDGARHAEWLSLIRKPLGIEKHKGGQLMQAGDALHRCIVSWLGGAIEDAACAEIANSKRPGLAM